MMIFGEIPGAIIAIETDFKCFCLKCNLKNEIEKEVYKPVSQRVILEKSKCKECGTTKRTYRKYAAFCKRTYKNMPHYGKQKTNKYSKLKWLVQAPNSMFTEKCSNIKPSIIRGMEHIAVQKGLKSSKVVNKQVRKAQKARKQRGPFGGFVPRNLNPNFRPSGAGMYPTPGQRDMMLQQRMGQPASQTPYQQPAPPNFGTPGMARALGLPEETPYQEQRAAMVEQTQRRQAQQEQMHQRRALANTRLRSLYSGSGYHSPTCTCGPCLELDRNRRDHRA